MKKLILVTLFNLMLLPLWSDEVTDSINEALEYYNNGDLNNAVSSLNYSLSLIQQKKGDSFKDILPEAIDGWEADEAQTNSMGNAFFGGGTSAERRYHKEDTEVTISITGDSPILQSMMMFFQNPMLMEPGTKLEKIGTQKAIVKYSDSNKDGEITIMVANRFLILVKGHGLSSVNDLKDYAQKIDFTKLSQLS